MVGLRRPNDVGTTAGPMVSEKQRDKYSAIIEKGKAEGARLLAGGGRQSTSSADGSSKPRSLWMSIHVDIAQEEIFGPVLSVITSKTKRRDSHRNQSKYGTFGFLWSASRERA
jgi:betaine-aldehyde dehydrogenase